LLYPEASDRRNAGSERRIAPHIHVRIATKGGEKCELANGGQSLYIDAISAKRFRHQKKARTRRAFQVSE
jgi:hypothetical protein